MSPRWQRDQVLNEEFTSCLQTVVCHAGDEEYFYMHTMSDKTRKTGGSSSISTQFQMKYIIAPASITLVINTGPHLGFLCCLILLCLYVWGKGSIL